MGSVSANIPAGSMVTPKPKLEWTPELHSIFMEAVDELEGVKNATPKKILEAMNVHGLTRLHVSSHLQKVRGFFKSGGHKRTNILARNHQHFIQSRQLDDPPPAALFNTNNSHHASYSGANDFVSTQGGDSFAGLNPILNYNTAYATNQETAVQTQFVPPTSPAALSNTNNSHPAASYNTEGGAYDDDIIYDLLPVAGDLRFIFRTEGVAGENNSTAGQENYYSTHATNQETAVLTQFVTPPPLPSTTHLDGHYDFVDSAFASTSWNW